MLSQDPALAVAEAEEATRSRQQWVRAVLRRMGAALDVSNAISMAAGPTRHDGQALGKGEWTYRRPSPSSFIPFRWRSEAVRGQKGGPNQAGGNRGGKVADLICCQSGVQANDNGWPVFKRKYVELPRFRKEW
jgi:hypothetical protein